MVAITEQAVWVEQIRQIEVNDPVQGGENGIDNIPHQQLASRTAFLKSEIDTAKGKIPEGEHVSLASLLQRIKELENKPEPIAPYMIPVGGLFETTKAYADGNALASEMGYGVWQEYGRGRVTVGATTQETGSAILNESNFIQDGVGNTLLVQMGNMGGEIAHKLTKDEMPKHVHRLAGSDWSPSSQDLKLSPDQVDLSSKQISSSMQLTSIHDDILTDNYSIEPTDWASAGGDVAHNNMQPYVVVGRWVRTA